MQNQREVNKSEFVDWKGSTVTQAVLASIKDRQDAIKGMLVQSAGLDPNEDRMLVGMIKAYDTLLQIDFSEVGSEE